MANIKYTCPECKAILKPSQPVPAGKKIKCPRCGHPFVASEAEEKAVAEKPTLPPKPAPKKPAADDDEAGEATYTVAATSEKDEDQAKETTKQIFEERMRDRYPKSKRGPAQAAITPPSNGMMAAGILMCIGYLLGIVIEAFPLIFTPEKPLTSDQVTDHWLWILLYILEFGVGGFITAGAVKMQNLDNYAWCLTACAVSILPFAFYAWIVTLPMGLWCVVTLRKPDVIAGFRESRKRGAHAD